MKLKEGIRRNFDGNVRKRIVEQRLIEKHARRKDKQKREVASAKRAVYEEWKISSEPKTMVDLFRTAKKMKRDKM